MSTGPLTTKINVWPDMIKTMAKNLMPDMHSNLRSSWAGPHSFLRFKGKEKASKIWGKVPRGVSLLFFTKKTSNIVPMMIIVIINNITDLKIKIIK